MVQLAKKNLQTLAVCIIINECFFIKVKANPKQANDDNITYQSLLCSAEYELPLVFDICECAGRPHQHIAQAEGTQGSWNNIIGKLAITNSKAKLSKHGFCVCVYCQRSCQS